MKKNVLGKIAKNMKNRSNKRSEPEPIQIDRLVKVTFGKPVMDINFRTVKIVTWMVIGLLFINIMFSIQIFRSSIAIANHLGYFINLVAAGEGTKLPAFQSISPFFAFIVNIAFCAILSNLFKRVPQPKLNKIMFYSIIFDVLVIFVTFIVLFVIMGHIYGKGEGIHDGIVEAMNNYSSNSAFKRQIDRLQVEFQCCGSKKYDDWYTIPWYDANLMQTPKLTKRKADSRGKIDTSTDLVCESCQDGSSNTDEEEINTTVKTNKGKILKNSGKSSSQQKIDSSKGNTPFSCCSITSMFPCIHHNIEITGTGYLYTPEQNLSISTDGCHTKLRDKTIEVGWNVIGNLTLLIIFQIALIISLRILQTAHFAKSMFEGNSRPYTIWIFGFGSIISGNDTQKEPPPLPPIPLDLMS